MAILLPSWSKSWTVPSRYKIAHGGRGSGKSWTIARLLLLYSMQYSTRVLCAREYQASIADSVHKLLADTIDECKLPGFRVLNTKIEHKGGSSFSFRGLAKNPHSIKSSEGFNIVWVEEAEAVTDQSYRLLIPTIRTPHSEIWLSFNPRYLTDATCTRFYAHNAPSNAIVSEVNWYDNPWFPDVLRAEKDRDYLNDPELAEHTWGGKTLHFSSASVLNGKYSVEAFEPGEDWDGPYYGVDFGSTDPSVAIKCWLFQDQLFVEDELFASNVDNLPVFFSHMEGLAEHVSTADNAWPDTIKNLKRNGFPKMTACKKGKGSILEGIKWLRGRQKIIIHPKCENTRREARDWKWKTDTAGNVIPGALVPGNDHCWDAIRYAVEKHILNKVYTGGSKPIGGSH